MDNTPTPNQPQSAPLNNQPNGQLQPGQQPAQQPEQPAPQPGFTPPAPVASPAGQYTTVQNPVTSPSQSTQWQGAFAAYKQAFAQVKKNPQPAVALAVVFLAASLIDLALFGAAPSLTETLSFSTDQTEPANEGTFSSIAQLVLLVAMITYALAVADRLTISISQLFKTSIKTFFYAILTLLLLILIFVVSSIPLGIPLIWVLPWFYLSLYAVVDRKFSPIASLKESKRLAQNHKAKVWGYIGITFLLGLPILLLGLVPFVGAILTAFFGVVSYGASAILYRWLQTQSDSGQSTVQSTNGQPNVQPAAAIQNQPVATNQPPTTS